MSTAPPPPLAPPAPAPADAAERVLLDDPCGAFGRSDADTRARCLDVVRAWAARTGRADAEVAALALRRAREAAARGDDPAAAHVGWWLVGEGAEELERELGIRPGAAERLRRFVARRPALCHLSLLAAAFLALGAGVVALGRGWGAGWALPLLFLAIGLPVYHEAAAGVALLVLRPFVGRHGLARLELPDGIPDDCRTLVVIPTLFTTPEATREQVLQLERLAHSNPDPNLRVAILSDFTDADAETRPGDLEILSAAAHAVHYVNESYPCPHGPRFFVLHRERRWNPAEGVWMGWERKRGKMEELNRLLRDPGAETTYRWTSGGFERLAAERPFRYVITLDEDTWLPTGEARRMVGTAAHPLNRPRYDPRAGRVTRGYGVVQPTLVMMPPEPMTRFAWVRQGSMGPVRHVDFGFDLYGDASWMGKGLYDVHAFAAATDGAFPENAVLSHDYLEGYLARTATAGDSCVVEHLPARYAEQAPQRHRWIRGDWQALPWVFGRTVRGADGAPRPNPLSAAARYRIFRQVDFGVKPVSRLALLLLAWLALPGPAGAWTLLAFADVAMGVVMFAWAVATGLLRPRDPDAPRPRAAWGGVVHHLLSSALDAAVLPSQATLAADGAGRALWRMRVSRRRLLEWTAQRQVARSAGGGWRAYLRALRASAVAGPAALAAVAWLAPGRLPAAAPFAVAWTLAFALVAWLDQPIGGAAAVAARDGAPSAADG